MPRATTRHERVCRLTYRMPVSRNRWSRQEHGHEHGAWTFNLQAKMMCLFDMDVSVRDTGEDRRLQSQVGRTVLLAGSKGMGSVLVAVRHSDQ